MPRGQLILIEGLDRSGKSTQSQLLFEKFSPNSALIKFPNRETKIGSIINQYLTDPNFNLSDQSAHLLFLANRWELAQSIIDDLNEGKFVVLDRYIYSGIAYSLAKLKHNSTHPELSSIDWLYSPDKGLPKPDLTLFLTLDLKELGNRKGWGEERYEKEEFQKSVKACFEEVFRLHDRVTSIDVNGKNIEQVTELIWKELEAKGVTQLTDREIEKFE